MRMYIKDKLIGKPKEYFSFFIKIMKSENRCLITIIIMTHKNIEQYLYLRGRMGFRSHHGEKPQGLVVNQLVKYILSYELFVHLCYEMIHK